jgi:hypothetical protein
MQQRLPPGGFSKYKFNRVKHLQRMPGYAMPWTHESRVPIYQRMDPRIAVTEQQPAQLLMITLTFHAS